ncbi:MAG: hypothetical protein ABGY09_04810 [Euryarchaeota archaeon]
MDEQEELLVAAVAALEEASWEIMGRGRAAFIRYFSRVLARELRALGHEEPEEQLHLLFGAGNVDVEERDTEVRILIRDCPFCVVEELLKGEATVAGDGGLTDVVCVTIGLVEELFNGVAVKCQKSDGVCEITVRRE